MLNIKMKQTSIIMSTILPISISSLTKKERRALKRKLWLANNQECYLCHEVIPFNISTFDHIHPLVRGGPDVLDNIAIACTECNSEKNDLCLNEYRILLSLMDYLDKANILYNLRSTSFSLPDHGVYIPELALPGFNVVIDIKAGHDKKFLQKAELFKPIIDRVLVVFSKGMLVGEFIHTLQVGGFTHANLYINSQSHRILSARW